MLRLVLLFRESNGAGGVDKKLSVTGVVFDGGDLGLGDAEREVLREVEVELKGDVPNSVSSSN